MRAESDVESSAGVLVRPHEMSETSAAAQHQPVMVAEVLHYLNPHPGAVIVDGTAGGGGHALAILPRLLPSGRLIAIDRDRESLEVARARLVEFASMVTMVHDNARHLPAILAHLGLSQVDGALLDLGMSSLQLAGASRGFSFTHEGPLDMRMDQDQTLTAETLVNTLTADELTVMLTQLGEERFAGRIARRIIEQRRVAPIRTTAQLARLVIGALPAGARHGRVHAATRTFQALRMAVNDELGALEDVLRGLDKVLAPGGRAVILTFHSLEDRMVKQHVAEGMRSGLWTVLTKKPERATDEEVARNPRARSAKLRAIARA